MEGIERIKRASSRGRGERTAGKGLFERAKERTRESCEEGFGCKSEKEKEGIACISAGASCNPVRGFKLPELCDFQESLLLRLAAKVRSGSHGSFSILVWQKIFFLS